MQYKKYYRERRVCERSIMNGIYWLIASSLNRSNTDFAWLFKLLKSLNMITFKY